MFGKGCECRGRGLGCGRVCSGQERNRRLAAGVLRKVQVCRGGASGAPPPAGAASLLCALRSGEAGSYLRLIDSCITQLKAHGPSRTCNESKEEDEKGVTSNDREGLLVAPAVRWIRDLPRVRVIALRPPVVFQGDAPGLGRRR